MGIVADFADFVFGSVILNIISCSFLMLLAIEAGLIAGPEVLPCSTGWFNRGSHSPHVHTVALRIYGYTEMGEIEFQRSS